MIRPATLLALIFCLSQPVLGLAQSNFPDAPALLSRPLEQARQALAKEQYSDAIDYLVPVLGLDDNDPETGDYFLPSLRKVRTRSLLDQARNLIGQMPSRGRDVFELRFGIQARKLLEKAVQAGDLELMQTVSRRFLHTQAGNVATLLLGQEAISKGNNGMAVRYLEHLMDNDAARTALNPKLSILYSIALYRHDRREQAVQTLVNLKDNHPNLQFLFNGELQQIRIVDKESTGRFLDRLLKKNPDWAEKGGEKTDSTNESNPSSSQADAKLIRILPIPAWSIRKTGSDAHKPGFPGGMFRTRYLSSGNLAFPVARAESLLNTAVFWSRSRYYAVNLATGKRIWNYPWTAPSVSTDRSSQSENRLGLPRKEPRKLQRRVTSDHQRIYLLEGEYEAVLADRQGPGNTLPFSNSLVALNIINENGVSVEGQLAWRIDSENPRDSALKGAVFRGPPVIHGSLAYVIYEVAGQIRVGALRADSGDLIWSQQLVSAVGLQSPDQMSRRLAHVVIPVVADGLLICPTELGKLVAIDLTNRQLKWGASYPVDNSRLDLTKVEPPPGYQSAWHENALAVSGSLICCAPVDSNNYLLVDLENGRVHTPIPKADNELLAGVIRGQIILVGQDEIRLDPVEGSNTTRINLKDFGKPAGRGAVVRQYYLQPLTNRQLLVIDLQARRPIGTIETGCRLGNLSYHRGRIISSSDSRICALLPEWTARSLLERGELASDADRYALEAQLSSLQGNVDAAIAKIRQSIMSAGNYLNREFLARLLVRKIQQDAQTVDWKKLDDISRLLQENDLRRLYLSAKFDALFRSPLGTVDLEDVLELVDFHAEHGPAESELAEIGPGHLVSGLRKMRTRLQEAAKRMPPEVRSRFIENLELRLEQSIKQAPPDRLRFLCELLADFEFMDRHWLAIGRRFAGSDDRDTRWATVRLMEVLKTKEDPADATAILRVLAELESAAGSDQYSAFRVAILNSLLTRLKQIPAGKRTLATQAEIRALELQLAQVNGQTTDPFPDGMTRIRMGKEDDALAFGNVGQPWYSSRMKSSHYPGQFDFQVGINPAGFFSIRDRWGRILLEDDLRGPGRRRTPLNPEVSHCQVIGPILVISAGHNHIGIDLTKLPNATPDHSPLFDSAMDPFGGHSHREIVLWRFSALEPGELSRPGLTRNTGAMELMSTGLVDVKRNRIGVTSLLTSDGICLIAGNRMVCLDPLTGRPHWMKSGIEPGTDMIGTAEHVYLFSPDDRRVLVHRTLDGKQISKLNVPEEMVNRYLQLGRQVVSSRTVGNQVTLSGFVLSPEGIRKTWDRAFARDSVAARFDASNIAVLAPDGSYQILDLVNGKSRSKVPLNSSVEAKSLSVVHFGDQYLLLVNRKSHVQVETRRYRGANDGRPEVSLDGEIHLMDSKGPLWQSPVRVDDFDFILNQPPTAPAFLLRKEEKDFAGTELVFVRRSDGASIEFGKNVPTDRPTTYFEVDSRKGFYTFNMGFHAFNLEFTRYPRPVEPPAQLGAFSNLPKPRTNKENRPKDLFLNSNDQFLRKATLLKNWADAEWAANPLKQIINND